MANFHPSRREKKKEKQGCVDERKEAMTLEEVEGWK